MQLVGFFLVEDRVQRGAEALTRGLQLDGAWESAAAALKALLEAAFQSGASAPHLLQLKDAVLRACSALGEATEPCSATSAWDPRFLDFTFTCTSASNLYVYFCLFL